MTEQPNHLRSDLNALRYLEALNQGDLETVASLWDEASRDPRLAQVLSEVDDALYAEQTLEKQGAVRGRPHGPVAGMVSARRTGTRSRWLGVVAAGLAAAALLIVLNRLPRDVKKPTVDPTDGAGSQAASIPPADDEQIAAWRHYRAALDDGDLPGFHWPLHDEPAPQGVTLDSSPSARIDNRIRPL